MRNRMSFLESRAILFRALSCLPYYLPALLTSRRAGLTDLLTQRFARIPHALVLVGIRRTQRAHVGGDLPQKLAIRTRQHQVRLFVDLHVDPVRQIKLDGVRIAQSEGGDAAFDV